MERQRRLRSEADHRRIRAEGRPWGSRLMTMLVAPNGLPQNRYGVIVSKRVGNAVTRNLVKRRMREILRHLDRAGRIATGHDLAFIMRPAAAQAPFGELQTVVARLLRQAGLLRPEREQGAPGEARAGTAGTPPAEREGTVQP